MPATSPVVPAHAQKEILITANGTYILEPGARKGGVMNMACKTANATGTLTLSYNGETGANNTWNLASRKIRVVNAWPTEITIVASGITVPVAIVCY